MKTATRVFGLLLVGVLAVTLSSCNAANTPPASTTTPQAPATSPDLIALPNGFAPEGITSHGNFIYVGSIPTGAVYRADITSGEGTIVVPAQADHASLGMKMDGRERLYVAGGPTGKVFVYDAMNGAQLGDYTLTTNKQTFINDVTLTSDAAWFTDSKADVLYRVALSDGSLPGQEAVSARKLTGDFKVVNGPDAFNLNGIAWTGSRLISVQSATGLLFSIDPTTGVAMQIDLGGEKMSQGDGLWLEGNTLYVVQNRLNQVAVIELAEDSLSGEVSGHISSPQFDVPTTIAATGTSLYLPNARFETSVTPTTTYDVVRIDKPKE